MVKQLIQDSDNVASPSHKLQVRKSTVGTQAKWLTYDSNEVASLSELQAISKEIPRKVAMKQQVRD